MANVIEVEIEGPLKAESSAVIPSAFTQTTTAGRRSVHQAIAVLASGLIRSGDVERLADLWPKAEPS